MLKSWKRLVGDNDVCQCMWQYDIIHSLSTQQFLHAVNRELSSYNIKGKRVIALGKDVIVIEGNHKEEHIVIKCYENNVPFDYSNPYVLKPLRESIFLNCFQVWYNIRVWCDIQPYVELIKGKRRKRIRQFTRKLVQEGIYFYDNFPKNIGIYHHKLVIIDVGAISTEPRKICYK